MPKLTEQEQQEVIYFIEAGKPLLNRNSFPFIDSFRFYANDWHDYNRFKLFARMTGCGTVPVQSGEKRGQKCSTKVTNEKL
jgi:hypothetical protein